MATKKTEFDRDFFFGKIKEVMADYDCGEPIEKGDAIEWRCKTTERDVSHVDDDGNWITRRVRLDIRAYAKYDAGLCSVGFDCSGHGEYFGGCSPYKTQKDMRREALEGSLGCGYMPKRTGPRYEQLTLF